VTDPVFLKELSAMPIEKDDIIRAYQLFLGREASAVELQTMLLNVKDMPDLRRVFFESPEFQAQLGLNRRNAGQNPEAVIHIHVPKTAGTSLNEILRRNYAPDAVMQIAIHEMGRLLALPPEDRRRVKVLMGHLQYGVARHLPQNSVYVAVLRDPGPRLFSFYRFILRTDTHPLHREFLDSKLSFGGFLRRALDDAGLRLEIDNGQTRRMAGQMLVPDVDYRAMFATAMRNMALPEMIVGTAERFEALLYTLWTRGLIADAANCFENVGGESGKYEAALESLDAAERGLMESYCYWDRLLHQAANLLVDGTQCDIPEAAAVA
jgi:hypothetical protein